MLDPKISLQSIEANKIFRKRKWSLKKEQLISGGTHEDMKIIALVLEFYILTFCQLCQGIIYTIKF